MNRYDIALNKINMCVRPDKDPLSAEVWNSLCDYTEFDVDDLLAMNDAVIFGGAVRDSIAKMEIHDVDILALPESSKLVRARLKDYGYKLLDGMSKIDINGMYNGLKMINEPWTFAKGSRIIQVIRPVLPNEADRQLAEDLFKYLLSNVDISACGVIYTGKVMESVENAIGDCKTRHFSVSKYARLLQTDRIDNRIAKLEDRGWHRKPDILESGCNFPVNEKEIGGAPDIDLDKVLENI
jgi:hypothetical protein